MSMSRVDEMCDPGYLAGLETLPLEQVRARRAECSDAELDLSYLRRLVQGRLDIVLDEQTQRSHGHRGTDVAALVERLPQILSGSVHAPGFGRLPTTMAPAEVGVRATAALDAIAPPERIAGVAELPDADLDALSNELRAFERHVSDQRGRLHQVLDRLQAEVVRRYQTGEATVDRLLE